MTIGTKGREEGFTLVELMIVVAVIGVLAAIAIPNYISMVARARESQVKNNMHTLQLAVEDFSVENNSFYPVDGSSSLPDGRTLRDLCPGGEFPPNPFTHAPTVLQWNSNPTTGNPGELAMNPAMLNTYIIKGNDPKGDTLALTLTSGQ